MTWTDTQRKWRHLCLSARILVWLLHEWLVWIDGLKEEKDIQTGQVLRSSSWLPRYMGIQIGQWWPLPNFARPHSVSTVKIVPRSLWCFTGLGLLPLQMMSPLMNDAYLWCFSFGSGNAAKLFLLGWLRYSSRSYSGSTSSAVIETPRTVHYVSHRPDLLAWP